MAPHVVRFDVLANTTSVIKRIAHPTIHTWSRHINLILTPFQIKPILHLARHSRKAVVFIVVARLVWLATTRGISSFYMTNLKSWARFVINLTTAEIVSMVVPKD